MNHATASHLQQQVVTPSVTPAPDRAGVASTGVQASLLLTLPPPHLSHSSSNPHPVPSQMGGTVTEAGAISAMAAFFRRNMDACAWTEEETSPPLSTTNSAPPLLRFPLRSTHRNEPSSDITHGHNRSNDSAAASSPRGRGRPSPLHLVLVVSRGPGPDFSEGEARVTSHAAVLLSQALASIRDRAALSEANDALEKIFRGMQEASDAVAALVEERDRRAQHEEARRADLTRLHEGAMSAAADELEGARRVAGELRMQLAEAAEAGAVVAGGAEDVCRAVAGALGAGDVAGRRGDADGEGVGVSDDGGEGVRELVAVIEGAARRALRCSHARVTTTAGTEIESAGHQVWKEKGTSPERRRRENFSEDSAPKGPSGDPLEEGQQHQQHQHHAGEHNNTREEDGARSEEGPLRVTIPRFDGTTEPLVLSVHGPLPPHPARKRFSPENRSVASALAACLGTALQALRERQRASQLARQIQANRRARAQKREAEAVHTAATEVEAREHGERAVAGMRALVSAAQASRAQAQAGESAARRARRQTDTLRHLLLRLDGVHDKEVHAEVAGVVEEMAGRAVPGCEGAVLLTPRPGESVEKSDGRTATAAAAASRSGCHGGGVTFAPDPRAWATAAVSRARQQESGSEGEWRGWNGLSKRAARKVENAAAEAAITGEAVCVTIDGFDEGGASDGREGVGAPTWSRVFCFSPVVAAVAPPSERGTVSKERAGPACPSGRVRATELDYEGTKAGDGEGVDDFCGTGSTPCLIAWMLCPGTGDEAYDADQDDDSAGSATLSSLTENVASSASFAAAADATPASPPRPPLPPHVFQAMEAVVHAVHLALSSAAATNPPARGPPERSTALHASRRQQVQGLQSTKTTFSSPTSKENRRERKTRDQEMRRLREGTASLADRVQSLETRAATLRASEARSAAALARARADIGAVTGQLQLTALERDRLLRRLEEADAGRGAPAAARVRGRVTQRIREEQKERRVPLSARSAGNLDGEGGLRLFSGGVLAGAYQPFGDPSPTASAGGRLGMANTNRRKQIAIGGGVDASMSGVSSWPLEQKGLVRSDASAGERRSATGGSGGGGVGVVQAEVTAPQTGSLRASPLSHRTADDASSAALQHMASVHARLSDSLKRGTGSLLIGAV